MAVAFAVIMPGIKESSEDKLVIASSVFSIRLEASSTSPETPSIFNDASVNLSSA